MIGTNHRHPSQINLAQNTGKRLTEIKTEKDRANLLRNILTIEGMIQEVIDQSLKKGNSLIVRSKSHIIRQQSLRASVMKLNRKTGKILKGKALIVEHHLFQANRSLALDKKLEWKK